MAVDAASTTFAGLALTRVRAVPVRLALGGLVTLSCAVRVLAALAHATPLYFPEEYIYGTIARNVAQHGQIAVRGAPAHFPALLEPLLAAPFWLFGNAELAYRLTQGLNALAMSLAAVPLYLLCRRLGLGPWLSLGAAAVALASPDFLFTSFVLSDPIAYPLVITAVYLGVRALDRPTKKAQLAFLCVAGLAAFARIQYVVLPVAFLLAALIVDRRRIARYWPTVAPLALPALAVAVLGTSRVLGYYSLVAHQHVPVLAAVKWAAIDTMMLAYSAGWILVPGALVGLALALARPRERVERAFAALSASLALLLFVEAAIYAARGTARYQERYLFVLLPLVAPLFGLYVRRGWPGRKTVALLAAAMLALSARVPLSGFTAVRNKQDSPFLFAVFRLEHVFGVGTGTLLVAIAAGLLSVAAVVIARHRSGAAVALGLTAAVALAASFGAFAFDRGSAAAVRASEHERDLSWIDRSGLRHVLLVQTQGGDSGEALSQLFWNGSVDRVGVLLAGEPLDAFPNLTTDVSSEGWLAIGGRRVSSPLLFNTFAARPQLAGMRELGHGGQFRLFAPAGVPRLSLLGSGLYHDGWLARGGVFRIWPNASGRARGTLTLRLHLPPHTERTPMRFRWDGHKQTVQVPAGGSRTVSFRFDTPGVFELHFSTTQTGTLDDGRAISVKSDEPVLHRT